jgi:putative ABC transport system permease protein
MILFNIRLALRKLLKNRTYTLINLFGLAFGITAALFILLWIADELSYDRFFSHASAVYRVVWHSSEPQTRTPHPMAGAMVRDFPEVEEAVSLSPVFGPGLSLQSYTLRIGDKYYEEDGFFIADSTFFDVFDFTLVAGDPRTALDEPGGVVISRKMADRYFGGRNAIGAMFSVDSMPMVVTGVVEDMPDQSHLHIEFLISYVSARSVLPPGFFEWSDFGHYNYILLRPDADYRQLEAKLNDWSTQYIQYPEDLRAALERGDIGFRLQPVTGIHLHSNLKWELEPGGDITVVKIFSLLAVLILTVAVVNYMNLSTARSAGRRLELALKKVNGAGLAQLRLQLLVESVILCLAALLAGVLLFELLLPWFNTLVQKNLSLDYRNPVIIAGLLGSGVALGLTAGFYPAWILPSFPLAGTLKGAGSGSRASGRARKALVVFQFGISAAMIVGTLIVYAQIHFLEKKKLGLNSENLLVVPVKSAGIRQAYEEFKAELSTHPGVLASGAISNLPGRNFNQNPLRWKGSTEWQSVSQLRVDYDFIEVLGLKLESGRSFSRDIPADRDGGFLINAAAARIYNWDDPVGEEIIWEDDETIREGVVIGVVEDFHFRSLHQSIEPLIINILPESCNYLLVRLSPAQLEETLTFIEKAYRQRDHEHAFEYFFLDQDFDQLYRAEQRAQVVFSFFAALAILISCLGLFSLSAYDTERRTVEIGVRKVNGASTAQIITMLAAGTAKMIFISLIIALPTGWFAVQGWMQHFAYKVEIGPAVFLIATGLTGAVAFLTVAGQTYRAARKNPADALRHE